MSDPLAFLSLALAAAGGQIDGQPAARFVAAGHTLLQRSAPLVRAMAGRRSAILLPPGGAFLTALAASDGRGALLLSPTAVAERMDLAHWFAQEQVGAVFTSHERSAQLPVDLTAVWLDEVPLRAVVRAGGVERAVDLGSHFGLPLAGNTTTEGSPEECLQLDGRWYSHADLLAAARARGLHDRREPTATVGIDTDLDWSPERLTLISAVLLHGRHLVTSPPAG